MGSSISRSGSLKDSEANRRGKVPSSPSVDSFKDDSRLDTSGEDDWTFFRARPETTTRIRSAFPGEFSRKILKQGRGRQAVIIVAIARDPVTGEPRTRGRGILFVEGGRA